MRNFVTKWSAFAVLVGAGLIGGQSAQAGGYIYQTRPVYLMPPTYAYPPIYAPPPVVAYEPVVAYPAPVAGYVTPISGRVAVAAPVAVAPVPVAAYAAPVVPGRVVETQVGTPGRGVYRYHVHSAYGPDYTYRVRENARTVRFSERWSR